MSLQVMTQSIHLTIEGEMRPAFCLTEGLKRHLWWFCHITCDFTCSILWLNWLWPHLLLPALEEAKDICTYLRPLQRLFEDMESTEFPDVKGQIGPLLHTVCLVWANSRYYNTPARLIVLLQETCNLLIQQVCSNNLCYYVVITAFFFLWMTFYSLWVVFTVMLSHSLLFLCVQSFGTKPLFLLPEMYSLPKLLN